MLCCRHAAITRYAFAPFRFLSSSIDVSLLLRHATFHSRFFDFLRFMMLLAPYMLLLMLAAMLLCAIC